MRQYISPVLFCLSCYAGSIAAADASVTMFSMQLGKPLSLPSCDDKKPAKKKIASTPSSEICKTKFSPTGASVEFPTYACPRYMGLGLASCTMQIRIREGNVDSIHFFIRERRDDEAYKAMIEKFGKPGISEIKTYKNGFGASFEKIEAYWSLSDGAVATFNGNVGTTYPGYVKIVSKMRLEEDAKDADDRRKREVKM